MIVKQIKIKKIRIDNISPKILKKLHSVFLSIETPTF